MILSQITSDATPHQPVPVQFFTWENLVLFMKFTWLVGRAMWPVWALLAFFAAVKLVAKRVMRTR